MIEVFPIHPPEPTEENICSSNGPLQNIERCIVFLQFRHLPGHPFLRASDISASAWKKGTIEYLKQCDAIRSGPIRGHLQLGKPDNVDKNGNLLLTKRGKKQSRAYTIQSFRNTITLESFKAATTIINEVCGRHADHVAAGRQNVHFYYDHKKNTVIECDLDKGESPIFPESHTTYPKDAEEVEDQDYADNEGDSLMEGGDDQSEEDYSTEGVVEDASFHEPPNKETKKSIRLRKVLLCTMVALVLIGLCIIIPHSRQDTSKPLMNEAVSDALFDQEITAYESSCFLPTYPKKPFIHKGLINRQRPLTPGTLIPFELAIIQLHPRVRSPINLLDSPP